MTEYPPPPPGDTPPGGYPPPPPGGYPPPPGGNYPPLPPGGNYPPPPPGGYYPPPPGGYQQPGGGYRTLPDNHLVWAILTTLFCCIPLGIVSIVKASQVSGLWAQGRYPEAQKAADDAKKWAIWAAVSGVIVGVIVLIVQAQGANLPGWGGRG